MRKSNNTDTSSLERPQALPEAVAHHTSLALYKVALFMQAELDRALEPTGMSTRHYSVLSSTLYKGPMSQQAVGQKVRIDRATMVGLVDDLERLGLLERRRNTEDRRLYDLTVTDAGRQAVDDAELAVREVETRLFAPLSKTGRTQLHRLLSQLMA
jgi:MarR family transcriptional regulator, lower aerobic nicotinate degradation pathway regulator